MSDDYMTYPPLSVIICTYNRSDLLASCLRSLVDQTLENGRYEVIIVNNNSTDDTQEIIESFTSVYVNFRAVVEMKQGLSHARNRGWREAHGEFVAYIDDDAKANPEWCERILYAFQNVLPQPVAVGGEIHPYYEVDPPDWFKDELEIRTCGTSAAFLKPPRARYGFSGSNMAVRKIIFSECGGFSPEYGMTEHIIRMGEDTEFFLRVYDLHPCFWYDPAILVYHWTPARNLKLSTRFWRSFCSGEALYRLQNKGFSLQTFIGNFLGIVLLLVKMPYTLVMAKGNFRLNALINIEEFGSNLGFMFGVILDRLEKYQKR